MVIGTDNYTAFIGMKDTIFVYTPTANLILKNFHRMSKVCIMHLQETIPIELKTFAVCRLMRGEIPQVVIIISDCLFEDILSDYFELII
jgi:hypothetical protein